MQAQQAANTMSLEIFHTIFKPAPRQVATLVTTLPLDDALEAAFERIQNVQGIDLGHQPIRDRRQVGLGDLQQVRRQRSGARKPGRVLLHDQRGQFRSLRAPSHISLPVTGELLQFLDEAHVPGGSDEVGSTLIFRSPGSMFRRGISTAATRRRGPTPT